jgi:hypothetical protein
MLRQVAQCLRGCEDESDQRQDSKQRAAINILGVAFRPLYCVAQTQNVGTLMVFEVTEGTKRILKQGIPVALAHKDYNLRTQIMGARRAIENKGVKLAPWEMPSA